MDNQEYTKELRDLQPLLNSMPFRFARLDISGIDNEVVLSRNAPHQRLEETCLFHESVKNGDAYVDMLASRIEASIRERKPMPVVRFADGEYAFYSGSLKCNGLYKQAESVSAIKASFPAHAKAMHYLLENGVMAPLIFPGNTRPQRNLKALLGKLSGKDFALRFLRFLQRHDIRLSKENYIPFYCVYAYLSSQRFASAVDGKTVCVVNSDFNEAACRDWFARAGSYPRLVHVPIPASYVATRWASMREEVFGHVPENPDCFMVGAGIGALEVCVDLSRRFSAPAFDSGHILNLMNDLESKSAGPRLYTYSR